MSTPPSFEIGQCWISEGEPDLGVGFVKAVDFTSVAIEFPSATQARLYRKKTAPLRRLEFRVGDKITPSTGEPFLLEKTEVRGSLFWYIGPEGQELRECDLSPRLTFQRPLERFVAGQWDPLSSYSLRNQTLHHRYELSRSAGRGLIGPRALLLPHQLYVTNEISSRGLPRALLADEVGLGKTIEASWILHRLLVTGRIQRVLIIVPETLVNQWFVELFKRFNLSFWVPSSQSGDEGPITAEDLVDQEHVILSLESLAELRAQGAFDEAKWDLVIVDEAHRVSWSEEIASAEYQTLEALARQSPGLLLLTATPEQLGLEGHFSRLHLLDPHRFPSLSAYLKEHTRYEGIAQLAEELLSEKGLSGKNSQKLKKLLDEKVTPEVLSNTTSPEGRRALAIALVDYYGTGRVYFRNSRAVVELEHFAFPKRILKKHVLKTKKGESGNAAFTRWLGEFARDHRAKKTLLICDSAKKAIEWEKKLRDDFTLKVVAFHEDLSLLARDRNAAYFADPAGASILLCSAIGGEGRNFQQASHLILVELPEDPDVLEQRIGRLDRIGQGAEITLHVPFFAGEREEHLLRWHEEVFDGFSAPTKGGRAIYEYFQEKLATLKSEETMPSKKTFDALLEKARAEYKALLIAIEAGRDRLIELNSFDPVEAPRIARLVSEAERAQELRAYVEALFEGLGITSDDLDAHSMFVEPGHSQHAGYLPGLRAEGMSFTLSRQQALGRDDLALLTWDHPMIRGALESITHQEFGNVAIAAWSQPLLLVESTFVLEPAAALPQWYAEEFFPATPVRIVLEATGKDLTAEWESKKFRSALAPLPHAMIPMVRRIPSERIRGLLRKAQAQAEKSCLKARIDAEAKVTATIDAEIARLRALQGKNQLVSEGELEWWTSRKEQLRRAYSGAQTRLDSFLVAVPAQLNASD